CVFNIEQIHNVPNLMGLPSGFNAIYTFGEQGKHLGGALLKMTVNGEPITFNIYQAHIHRKESIERYLKRRPKANEILFCNHLSDYLRQLCHDSNINYADDSGNVRVMTGNICIFIGNRPPIKQDKSHQFMTIGIMKCLFALFAEKDLINETYANIASKADISVGMVTKAMKYLIENNHIVKNKRQRRFLDELELRYEWLKNYDRILARYHQLTTYPPVDNWEDILLQPGDVWGGEVAAAQLTKYNRPHEMLLFSRHQPVKYSIGHKELPPLKVVKPFWGESLKIGKSALALLTMAELLLSKDERNREVAYLINDKHVKFNQLP
ncbi:type IV toxin-antitoxin system AbiEi family antitoxin, partial [Vibrio cholerae]